jgi:hypothetical protein
MNFINTLVPICLLILIILGIFLFIYSIVGFSKRNSNSRLKLPFIKAEIEGPAWLSSIVVGAILIGLPILLASFQTPPNVTPPPISVEQVRRIEEPNYKSFRFFRDVSILDLRSATTAPWYTQLPGWSSLGIKTKKNPGILRNYMIIKKVDTATSIHITYGTSGLLDVRCPTHKAKYRKSDLEIDGKAVEKWEVIADVSTIPVGTEFEMLIEATYWNGFSGANGDDYTTYAHEQTEPEQLSVTIFFPDDKLFKNIKVEESSNKPEDVFTPIQGNVQSWAGPKNETFYWSINSLRPNWYYKIAWQW